MLKRDAVGGDQAVGGPRPDGRGSPGAELGAGGRFPRRMCGKDKARVECGMGWGSFLHGK